MSPRSERFFLRMLPLDASGAKSVSYSRTVDDNACASVRRAWSRRGRLAYDGEWRRVQTESFPSELVPLSQVFTTIVAYCAPSYSLSLRNEQKSLFIADTGRRQGGKARVLLGHMYLSRFKSPCSRLANSVWKYLNFRICKKNSLS